MSQARHELERAGCEVILLEIGSGKDDAARPKFRQLREMVACGEATTVVCPSQDRLGRNLQLVVDFVSLCNQRGVPLLDLSGRALETASADGRFQTQMIGAVDEYRSALYGEKTVRGMEASRAQGFPTRPHLPFGLRKVRNEAGRFVAIELDPVTGPQAVERVQWFLESNTNRTLLRIAEEHGQQWYASRFRRWLTNPLLNGRLAWGRNAKATGFAHVEAEPSFPQLLDDETFARVQAKLATGTVYKALRGRPVRPLTSIVRCADCGKPLAHRMRKNGKGYLACHNLHCKSKNKLVHYDLVFQTLQWSLAAHAQAVAPLLDAPKYVPPEVAKLRQEIETLEAISGTESLVEAKREEITRLMACDRTTPIEALVAALRLPKLFWLQDDQPLNDALHRLVKQVVVQLGANVAESKVISVECRCSPSQAPLPGEQRGLLIPYRQVDVAVLIGAAAVAA